MFTTSRAATLAVALGLILGTATVARADDPAADGTYLVRSDSFPAKLRGSSVTIQVLLPSAASFARPVVIICHGWLAPTTLYEGMARHLASRGFAAVLFEQPNFYSNDMQSWADQTHDAISELARVNGTPTSSLFGELDMNKVGVMGHSRGGACATVLAGQDDRVKCAVALAPANMWSGAGYSNAVASAAKARAPYMAIIGASDNWWANASVVEAFYHSAKQSAERQLLEVTGGGHMMYFGGGANDLLSTRYYTAWLERFLMGKADADGWTTGVKAAAQKQQGLLTVAEHATATGGPTVTPPPAAPAAPAASSGVLQKGSKGQAVADLQKKLHDLGFYNGGVDGDFGDQTQQAVIAFQASKGLTADGVVGPKTKAALGI